MVHKDTPLPATYLAIRMKLLPSSPKHAHMYTQRKRKKEIKKIDSKQHGSRMVVFIYQLMFEICYFQRTHVISIYTKF